MVTENDSTRRLNFTAFQTGGCHAAVQTQHNGNTTMLAALSTPILEIVQSHFEYILRIYFATLYYVIICYGIYLYYDIHLVRFDKNYVLVTFGFISRLFSEHSENENDV